MGVAGAGKTTVGRRLADALGFQFVDADEFHPPANIEKMSHGVELQEEDRAPWLEALAAAVDKWLRDGDDVVLACSALKESHRAKLLRDPSRMRLVYLKVPPVVARDRVAQREGHFLRDDLVESQFDALEEPSAAIRIDASRSPEAIVRDTRRALRR